MVVLEAPRRVGAYLLILDIDDPRVIGKLPLWFLEIMEKTVVWKTGPRCPKCWGKYGIKCSGGSCKCFSCRTEFRLEDAPRGVVALFYADSIAVMIMGGSIKGGPVELVADGYRPLPPSLHPSGARYEWIRPFDFEKPYHGIYWLRWEELEKLYNLVRQLRGKQSR